MNNKNEHLVPEVIKNLCESFDKAWISENEKANMYSRLQVIDRHIQETLLSNKKYSK